MFSEYDAAKYFSQPLHTLLDSSAITETEERAQTRRLPVRTRVILAKYSKKYCYMAGSFSPTARALIGYFEVT